MWQTKSLPLTMFGMTCVRAIRSRARRGRNRLPPFRAAFPDLHFTLELLVAEADMVVGRWTATGTNTGLWGNIPPTGKIAKFSAVNIFRIANGKAVEIWNHQDDLGLLRQLDALIYAGSRR
jgi:predicted ester cyclase